MMLTEADVQPQLTRRRPGQSRLTTPRDESDLVKIMSGTEHGVTLGTPIALFVPNNNVRPGDYAEMSNVPRPGHADYTYGVKYGVRASSGGGRASARETIGRVAAGAIAEKWLLEEYGTRIVTFVSSVGTVSMPSAALLREDGANWTRSDVDVRGTLTILRDAEHTGWRCVASDALTPAQKEEQAALDARDEAAFLRVYNASSADCAAQIALGRGRGSLRTQGDDGHAASAANGGDSSSCGSNSGSSSAYGPCTPAYEDSRGLVYDMHGTLLPGVAASPATRSNDVLAVRCPHASTAARMASLIRAVKADEDSTGGVLTTVISGAPVGVGEPVFDKLEAELAHAMLSLPATKGFEIGSGFAGTQLRGSTHNDAFVGDSSSSSAYLRTSTNHSGGTLGGISNGEDIVFRVAIKPVSTIGQAQVTSTYGGEQTVLEAKGRHDPCVLPRAPPLVEAMAAICVIDAALVQRSRGPVSSVLKPAHV